MTDAAARPQSLQQVEIPVDGEGRYEDGHGDPTYVYDEDVLALHHVAVANGWEHSYERSPAANLRALLRATAEYDPERPTVVSFAFAFVAGLGPVSAPRALDRIDEGGCSK